MKLLQSLFSKNESSSNSSGKGRSHSRGKPQDVSDSNTSSSSNGDTTLLFIQDDSKQRRMRSSKSSSSSKSHKSRQNSKSRSSSHKSSTTSATTTEEEALVSNPDGATENERVMLEWIRRCNNSALVPTLSELVTDVDQVKFHLEDGFIISARSFIEMMGAIHASFPDFYMHPLSVQELKGGVVLAEEVTVRGTHTGEAFGFADYPPVPRSNKHVLLDPERSYATIRDGKIFQYQMVALGSMTGVHGLYMGIGGDMTVATDSINNKEKEESEAQQPNETAEGAAS